MIRSTNPDTICMAQIRAFIAIGISEEAKDEITRIIGILKKNNDRINWVKRENLHITLKFLGDIHTDLLSRVSDKIKDAALKTRAFSLSLGKLEGVPSLKNPKVVWMDIDSGKLKIMRLFEDVEKAMESIGFEKERRSFNAHITLGRVKELKNSKSFTRRVAGIKISHKTFEIDRILLKKSVLLPSGPVYSNVFEHLLDKQNLS